MPLSIERGVYVTLLLICLGGCANRADPPPVQVSQTQSIDGDYTGIANGSCGANRPARAQLKEGHFTLTVPPDLSLSGEVSPDGSLSASEPDQSGRPVNFSGRVQGTELRGGSYNGRCGFAFALKRIS